jgi:hypothetical protein
VHEKHPYSLYQDYSKLWRINFFKTQPPHLTTSEVNTGMQYSRVVGSRETRRSLVSTTGRNTYIVHRLVGHRTSVLRDSPTQQLLAPFELCESLS